MNATERKERLVRLRPGSQVEMYLAVIAEQMEELLSRAPGRDVPEGEVELSEPAKPKAAHRDVKKAQAKE